MHILLLHFLKLIHFDMEIYIIIIFSYMLLGWVVVFLGAWEEHLESNLRFNQTLPHQLAHWVTAEVVSLLVVIWAEKDQ